MSKDIEKLVKLGIWNQKQKVKGFDPEAKLAIEANLITESINRNFICLCCIEIVESPVACEKCRTLFCKECVNRQIKACPKCRKNFKKSEVDRICLDLLNEV